MRVPENSVIQRPVALDAMTLDTIPPSGTCLVGSVGAQGSLRKRLMEMGFVPGAHVEVIRVAPLGDPVEYRIKGYHISLRAAEAKLISVVVEGA